MSKIIRATSSVSSKIVPVALPYPKKYYTQLEFWITDNSKKQAATIKSTKSLSFRLEINGIDKCTNATLLLEFRTKNPKIIYHIGNSVVDDLFNTLIEKNEYYRQPLLRLKTTYINTITVIPSNFHAFFRFVTLFYFSNAKHLNKRIDRYKKFINKVNYVSLYIYSSVESQKILVYKTMLSLINQCARLLCLTPPLLSALELNGLLRGLIKEAKATECAYTLSQYQIKFGNKSLIYLTFHCLRDSLVNDINVTLNQIIHKVTVDVRAGKTTYNCYQDKKIHPIVWAFIIILRDLRRIIEKCDIYTKLKTDNEQRPLLFYQHTMINNMCDQFYLMYKNKDYAALYNYLHKINNNFFSVEGFCKKPILKPRISKLLSSGNFKHELSYLKTELKNLIDLLKNNKSN